MIFFSGGQKFYMNPFTGSLSLENLVEDSHVQGGILADEMGLGKVKRP